MQRIQQHTIAPGSAVSIELNSGKTCRVVNAHGGQVVDTWAFGREDMNEHLSMEHSRSANYKLLFEPGDLLFSNRFRPLLKLVADTSPGIHDPLHAACSRGSYQFYGADRVTPNCQDNLVEQLLTRGFMPACIPCPWNLFEHALVRPDSTLVDEPSAARAGDYVELEAVDDLILICSACPSTVGQISGSQLGGATVEL